jgi:hypothetical protein
MEDRDSFLVSTHAGGPNGGNFVMGTAGAKRAAVRRDGYLLGEKTSMVAFAIKAEVRDPKAKTFAFTAQKTMYGGKHIAEGDTVFVFASENERGQGLIARGIVTSVEEIAKKRGIARQTPRVSISITCTALAKRPLGRRELKHLTDWDDGQPGTELNFKFYRQATNKIVGISDEAAAFLSEFF